MDSRVGVYKRVGKTVSYVFKRAFQNIDRPAKQFIHSNILRAYSSEKLRKQTVAIFCRYVKGVHFLSKVYGRDTLCAKSGK